MTDTEVEFVNDWSALEAAVETLRGEDWGHSMQSAVDVIVDYVPRLLTQYAKLLELSFTLTDAWEAEHAHKTPEGLYLP